ncbi:hypothetical protein C2G38_2295422 [Gigaspora rosea]|uniref:BED-type domain-containing protein n=1 Tax=Gigaspora rosea TaxID=44941 RepID=A0A397U377_9GLOM|nr:hypothetical protein C2G38_2295422 [Gigaspora rosea]
MAILIYRTNIVFLKHLAFIETNEENSRKRIADLVDVTENSSESEEEHATNSSNQQSLTKKKSKQFAEICDYYLRGGEKSHRHYEATCYHCISKKTWARGKPAKLEAHLANECPNRPENISRY